MQVDARDAIGARRKGGIHQGRIDAAGAATELDTISVAIGVHKATDAAIGGQQCQRQSTAVDIINREIHQGATDAGVDGGRHRRQPANRGRIIHRVHVHLHGDRSAGFSAAVIQRCHREGA